MLKVLSLLQFSSHSLILSLVLYSQRNLPHSDQKPFFDFEIRLLNYHIKMVLLPPDLLIV